MSIRAVLLRAALLGTALIALAGCNETKKEEAAAAPAKAEAVATTYMYEVIHDGRINVFYDRKTYEEFLSLGETSFRLTRIGDGPNGETVVFGLTKGDKKKGANTPAAKLWDGKAQPTGDFYGELRNHGRIYVFNSMKDMEPVRAFGHPNFFYMEVGAGPQGETVVYVLNSKNKKKKPDALIARFKAENGRG